MYIFEINPLSVASFAIIFSQSEGCLFTLLIVPFIVQKLLSSSEYLQGYNVNQDAVILRFSWVKATFKPIHIALGRTEKTHSKFIPLVVNRPHVLATLASP